jgi:hypothetical protein
MRLVGFIIRIYHDARSSECQKSDDILLTDSGVPRGVVWGIQPPPPRNSEVLTKLSRISNSVENTS